MTGLMLRPIGPAEVGTVLALQAQCYPAQFLEDARAFEAKLIAARAYETCWMAWRGDQALAYLVSLPLCHDSLPALNAPDCPLPAEPRLLYLHDLAVVPAGRSLGLGRRLVARIEQRARALALPSLCLVAVQGSQPYWQGQGFAPEQELSPKLAAKLASFGADAVFMQRTLD
jgi:GNAT superfamily N-acetyltransferase